MKTIIYMFGALLFFATFAFSQKAPTVEALTVIKQTRTYGPTITPLLRSQTQTAWKQDEVRRQVFKNIKTENEIQAAQKVAREKFLAMIGGLPQVKTPLNAQLLDSIQMNGFHIEKLVFESIPGFYVTSLVYVPDNGAERHPAVLVACGHSPIAKIHYQSLCQRLVQRGYLVICWDPVGQGERSQFWNRATGGSRYNMVCGEHAILGNLAYLAGANLARWQVWDGIRAVDYLLSRPDVDQNRISITGTSGGGLQATYIGALDERIKVVMPSCYISAQPMRAYNRIFADPDSDPEQDLDGMISEGLDHAGLLLLMYPRPVFIAAAVLDFFPIEGTRKTFREISELYHQFKIEDRIDMVEGYHKHQFSPENQEAAFNFLDRFNRMSKTDGLPAIKELKKEKLQCTQSGQVLLEYPKAKNLTELIKEYFLDRQNNESISVRSLYYGNGYPGIKNWSVTDYQALPVKNNIAWQKTNHYEFDKIQIDHYLVHHSDDFQIPVLYFHTVKNPDDKIVLWINLNGKASQQNWQEISNLLKKGVNVISFDFRGTGEDRMLFEATPTQYLKFAKMDSLQIYYNSVSGVFANYVYNSLLTGRPYYLQMIEDTEIVSRFIQSHIKPEVIEVAATSEAGMLARDIVETLPGLTTQTREDSLGMKWSGIVREKRELWPIHYLMPGGALIR